MLYYLYNLENITRIFTTFGLSFLIVTLLGSMFISKMRKLQKFGQPIRDFGPESHLLKQGTPTLGGLLIILTIILCSLLFNDLDSLYIQLLLFVTISYGALGFADDYLKIKHHKHGGVTGKMKLIVQFLVAFVAVYVINISRSNYQNILTFPFFKDIVLDLGAYYMIFAILVIIGSSNAVNLTDGLDGLVSFPVILNTILFGIISLFYGILFHSHLKYFLIGAEEVAIFGSAVVGSLLGFLLFNSQPASIFMGDVGSLPLGGILGVMSILLKSEFLFALCGSIFVFEALSVILQVYYFKLTKGKRIFLMTPIHHHFEKLGWAESKVVIRFWVFSLISFGITLYSLFW